MKQIIVVLFVVLMVSCKDTNFLGMNLTYSVEISIKSSAGVDLLNPDNPGHYEEDQIRIYHVVDGTPKEIYYDYLDHPRYFKIYEHVNEYRIHIVLYGNSAEEYPTTLVKWNEMDTDTLRCQFERGEGFVRPSKVWFNDSLVFDFEKDGDYFYFEIIK